VCPQGRWLSVLAVVLVRTKECNVCLVPDIECCTCRQGTASSKSAHAYWVHGAGNHSVIVHTAALSKQPADTADKHALNACAHTIICCCACRPGIASSKSAYACWVHGALKLSMATTAAAMAAAAAACSSLLAKQGHRSSCKSRRRVPFPGRY
jgi:hypothetical protein